MPIYLILAAVNYLVDLTSILIQTATGCTSQTLTLGRTTAVLKAGCGQASLNITADSNMKTMDHQNSTHQEELTTPATRARPPMVISES